MTDRTARITRISSVAGYVMAAAGVVGLVSIALNQSIGEPWGNVNDVALFVLFGAIAPLMLAFYELGGRTPLRPAQLAQTLGWVATAVLLFECLRLAGVIRIDLEAGDSGFLVVGLALGYVGLWMAGANLLAGPWLNAVRWLGVYAGLSAALFAFGLVRGGVDSGWTWLGGVGLLAVGSVWAFLMARLLGARYRPGDGELG